MSEDFANEIDNPITETTGDAFLFKHRKFTVKALRSQYNCPECGAKQIFLLPKQDLEVHESELEDSQFLMEAQYEVTCGNCKNQLDVALVLDFHGWNAFFYVLTTTLKEIASEEPGHRRFKVSWLNAKFTCHWCQRHSWHSFPASIVDVPESGFNENDEGEATYTAECPTCGYTQEVSIRLKPSEGLIEIAV